MMLNAGWVSAAATVLTFLVSIAGMWLRSAFAARDEVIVNTRSTQKTLFEKLDVVARELQDYKLHVAETFVNQAALQKMIDPLDRRLEAIEKDLRGRGVGGVV